MPSGIEPYIIRETKIFEYFWNPEYPQGELCQCGHIYRRHFDPYEDMEAVGCKYCDCYEFLPVTNEDYQVAEELYESEHYREPWRTVHPKTRERYLEAARRMIGGDWDENY
jgi:tryptophan 2,3-dioxygenase